MSISPCDDNSPSQVIPVNDNELLSVISILINGSLEQTEPSAQTLGQRTLSTGEIPVSEIKQLFP